MKSAASAIADPVRREILERLRDRSASVGDIASWFPISRPAISRHLRVLRDSGLVHDTLVGRRRLYQLDPAPLAEIASWIGQFEPQGRWDQRFDALATEVARTRRQRIRTESAIDPKPAAHRRDQTEESA
jgi:DNA-binding transcriptional ArsR family regulator